MPPRPCVSCVRGAGGQGVVRACKSPVLRAPVQARHTGASVSRLGSIAKFAATAYLKTRLLDNKAADPEEVGAWIAAESARMGPLFIKLVQLISTRTDALDADLAAALSVVQDEVDSSDITRPSLPGYSVAEDRPIKAGSVASVWLATRQATGEVVVIKKLHQGVRASFESDLPLLMGVLQAAVAMHIPGSSNFYEIIRESREVLFRETDLQIEASTMRQFSDAGMRGVLVPQVIEAGTDYIIQSYMPSTKVTDVQKPCRPLARKLMVIFAKSILEVGLVHADMHPGNVGVIPDTGQVVMYDWGAAVDATQIRGSLATLFQALAVGNLERFVEAMQAMHILEATGADAYRVVRILKKLSSMSGDDFHVSLSKQPEFSDSAGNRLVRFSSTVVYILRALSLTEGVCRTLDPDFSYKTYWTEDLAPLVEQFLEAQDEGVKMQETVMAWLQSSIAVPDVQQRILDATHEMNYELREELVTTRRLLVQLALAVCAGAWLEFFFT